jgi:hypothetical protein
VKRTRRMRGLSRSMPLTMMRRGGPRLRAGGGVDEFTGDYLPCGNNISAAGW